MRISVVMGTRPEIIRLYWIVKVLKNAEIFWTGQNFEPNLSTDLFNDPKLKDAYKGRVTFLSTGHERDFCQQFSKMVSNLGNVMPISDKVLILGDTNSSLAGALVGKKKGSTIYHLEAGNRCYNPESPEEVNRRLIDSIADVHLCYTKFAKQNLLNEGVPANRIHVVGNPIAEFRFLHGSEYIPGRTRKILVTLHRKENEPFLRDLKQKFNSLAHNGYEVNLVLHPRYIGYFLDHNPKYNVQESVDFTTFVEMERDSSVIFTDSGTVCEEASLLNKPCVVLRETMERPELLEAGGTFLVSPANLDLDIIMKHLEYRDFLIPQKLPEGYEFAPVSSRVLSILYSKGNYK